MDQASGETHTYVARVWYRDTATLFNMASFLFLVLQDETFMAGFPDRWQHFASKAIVLFNLWIRFQSSTRPVALQQGATREVHAIPPRSGVGEVSDFTRRNLP